MKRKNTFIEYVGNCFLNSMGVAAYMRQDGSVFVRAEQVVKGRQLTGFCTKTFGTTEAYEEWKEKMRPDDEVGYYGANTANNALNDMELA